MLLTAMSFYNFANNLAKINDDDDIVLPNRMKMSYFVGHITIGYGLKNTSLF